jgi:multiple sugar transport system permease protein
MTAVPTATPDRVAPEAPAKVRRRGRVGTPGTGRAIVPTLFMLAFLVYFLMPLVWLVISSTKSLTNLFDSFGLWFRGFDLTQNISDTFNKDGGVFLTWIRNTLMYSVVSAGGAALLAAMAGYGFAKFTFRGKNLLFWIVLGSVMVPQTALAIPTYLLFSKVGLINNPLGFILPSLVSPFGIYLMRIYAESAVPSDLMEAARIDGAGEFLIFRRIAFRLLAPGFVTVLLFTFVATWNNYFLPLVLFSDSKWYPLTVGLAQWNSQATAGGGATAAFNLVITGALISVVPLIIAFLFLQRYWQSGLSAGSVKG